MFESVLFVAEDCVGALSRKILGLPVLGRVIRRMEQAGAARVTLVYDGDPEDLKKGRGAYPKQVPCSVVGSYGREFSPLEGVSTVVFAEGDLITAKKALSDFLEVAVGAESSVFALEAQEKTARKAQLQRFARVEDGRDETAPEDGFWSVGLCSVPSAAAVVSPGEADIKGVQDVVDAWGERSTIRPWEISGFWHRMGNGRAWGRAKSQLLNEQKKPVQIEGVLGLYLFRPISTKMSRVLAPLPVTPNHITALALILGWVAAGLMATGSPRGFVWAAIIMQFGAVIDCVDGELARVKDMGSRFGGWFDTVVDDIVNQSFLMGTAIGVYRLEDANWPLFVGIGSLILVLPALIFMYRELIRVGETDICMFPWIESKSSVQREPQVLTKIVALGEYVVKRDFYLTAFVMMILLGHAWLVPIFGLLGTIAVDLKLVRELIQRRSVR
jgi:phosphatidylglycerophosphate synthase